MTPLAQELVPKLFQIFIWPIQRLRLSAPLQASVPTLVVQRRNHKISYNPEVPKIPLAVIAVVSAALANRYSHADINQFMEAAGIVMHPLPDGNRQVKSRAWLIHANETMPDPLATLGKVISEFMELGAMSFGRTGEASDPEMDKITTVLRSYGFSYLKGGYISASGAKVVSTTLQDIMRTRDLPGLEIEFQRIYENLESDPESAVTASSALLESLFKSYIEEEGFELPSEQSLKPLWKIVRKNLNFDPALVEDEDLKTILADWPLSSRGLVHCELTEVQHMDAARGHTRSSLVMRASRRTQLLP